MSEESNKKGIMEYCLYNVRNFLRYNSEFYIPVLKAPWTICSEELSMWAREWK